MNQKTNNSILKTLTILVFVITSQGCNKKSNNNEEKIVITESSKTTKCLLEKHSNIPKESQKITEIDSSKIVDCSKVENEDAVYLIDLAVWFRYQTKSLYFFNFNSEKEKRQFEESMPYDEPNAFNVYQNILTHYNLKNNKVFYKDLELNGIDRKSFYVFGGYDASWQEARSCTDAGARQPPNNGRVSSVHFGRDKNHYYWQNFIFDDVLNWCEKHFSLFQIKQWKNSKFEKFEKSKLALEKKTDADDKVCLESLAKLNKDQYCFYKKASTIIQANYRYSHYRYNFRFNNICEEPFLRKILSNPLIQLNYSRGGMGLPGGTIAKRYKSNYFYKNRKTYFKEDHQFHELPNSEGEPVRVQNYDLAIGKHHVYHKNKPISGKYFDEVIIIKNHHMTIYDEEAIPVFDKNQNFFLIIKNEENDGDKYKIIKADEEKIVREKANFGLFTLKYEKWTLTRGYIPKRLHIKKRP